jgi:hypothetical protein
MELLRLKPSLNEEWGWEPVEDGCMVYSLDSTTIMTLNAAAELVLSYCDGSRTVAELYAVAREEAGIAEHAFFELMERLFKERVVIADSKVA